MFKTTVEIYGLTSVYSPLHSGMLRTVRYAFTAFLPGLILSALRRSWEANGMLLLSTAAAVPNKHAWFSKNNTLSDYTVRFVA